MGCWGGEYQFFQQTINYSPLENELKLFSEYLKSKNTPFVYFQAPYKMDLQDDLLPKGLYDYGNEAADYLLNGLTASGVKVLDLRDSLARDGKDIEKFFYATDHHWTPDGAFTAYSLCMDFLKKQVDSNLDTFFANKRLWERHEKNSWFLGSRGKRVGPYYAGTDNLIWYTSKIETNMSCEIPKYELMYQGDFADANIRETYIDDKDYYFKNAYCVYIGGDYPIVIHRNEGAPNNKSVLIIKDSFALPFQAFMSTEFTEVTVIDPRHYKETTIVEWCNRNKPDIVIMLINITNIGNAVYSDLGV